MVSQALQKCNTRVQVNITLIFWCVRLMERGEGDKAGEGGGGDKAELECGNLGKSHTFSS